MSEVIKFPARSGRFVLCVRDDGAWIPVMSWDTWAEAREAWPIEAGFKLVDDVTGREWLPSTPYEWEAART